MKTSLIMLTLILLFSATLAKETEAQDRKAIRISLTIPAIFGVSVPEPNDLSAEELAPNGYFITQVHQKRQGNSSIMWKTTVIK